MKVEFSLRIPGQHQTLPPVELDSAPRVGERVLLKGGDEALPVHEVMHDVARGIVCVLLRV